MNSVGLGAPISGAEVVGLSKHGFWLLLTEGEVFVPFAKFPWFKSAPVSRVLNVRRLSADHLRWPDLDVDLPVESLHDPEHFPLIAKSMPSRPPRNGRKASVVSKRSVSARRRRVR